MGLIDDMAVEVPEGESGPCRVKRFEVVPDSFANMRLMLEGRGCQPGSYTALMRHGVLWMSDTTAERRDHFDAALRIREAGGRVLIGGLGLGMILRVALLSSKVSHVDVVEIDQDVINLVGPHYAEVASSQGKGLTIHNDDVFTVKWPCGSHWSTAWFDVWPDLCTDNLESIAKLRRSYAQRSNWADCWGRGLLVAHRRRERAMGW